MSPRPVAIRKSEIERTVKAVTATGLSVTRIEIEGGKLVIYTSEGASPETPLEAWRRKHGKS